MSERGGVDEAWSALLDDEMSDADLDRVLDESSDPERRSRLQRYQIGRAVMRGERLNGYEFADLSARIRDSIEGEGSPDAASAAEVIDFQARASSRRAAEKENAFAALRKSVGSVAIAASVAAVVVLGARSLETPVGLQPASVVADSSQQEALQASEGPEIIRTAEGLEQGAGANADSRQSRFILHAGDPRISDYQRRHLQFTAQAGGGGMMPFARVVSLESEQR